MINKTILYRIALGLVPIGVGILFGYTFGKSQTTQKLTNDRQIENPNISSKKNSLPTPIGLIVQPMKTKKTEELNGVTCAVLNLDDYQATKDATNRRFSWLINHDPEARCLVTKPPMTLLKQEGLIGKTTGMNSSYDVATKAWLYEIEY